jgi:hypothetical protein
MKIYCSSQDVAQDLELLISNGITHVVNVATGVRCHFPKKIIYLALTAMDLPTENLKRHFDKAIKFMRKAVEDEGGKVLNDMLMIFIGHRPSQYHITTPLSLGARPLQCGNIQVHFNCACLYNAL